MDVLQLAPDEPLSPELVLVLPPELRARVLETLGDPVYPAPKRPLAEASPEPLPARALAPAPPAKTGVLRRPPARRSPRRKEPLARSLGAFLGTRLVQLGLIFASVTIVTLAMTLVAQAVR